MLIFSENLKEKLNLYSNVNNKISREIQNGNLIQLKKGLYETDANIPGYYLANAIYGPSYLSFDFALSFYGLIPEKVTNYTSATFDKKKKRKYTNQFGTYLYRDVPNECYPYGIKIMEEENYTYQIATPEKALCDKLYTLSPVKNINEMEELLFHNLRIDKEEIKKLNLKDIELLESKYHSTNVTYLYKLLRRKQRNE